jgi:formylglycine-generating enzyme required for sulfatase activity
LCLESRRVKPVITVITQFRFDMPCIIMNHLIVLFAGWMLLLAPAVRAAAPAPAPAPATPAPRPDSAAATPPGMVLIPSGTFKMGIEDGFPYEAPVHEVALDSFWIDEHEVTVAQFQQFVDATHYKTEAEKFAWSGVFDLKSGEWTKVDGANWRHPMGPASAARPNDPVVHVSILDAQTYARWAGKRLPTEAEFEYAARGGLDHKKYAWGDELTPGGKFMANTWQGHFPEKDQAGDKFSGVAPVKSFPPNGYGLYDMTGNVWEWCSDWFDPDYYAISPKNNPAGPANGTERSIRGGSWMCSENYCVGYRVGARNKTAPDSGLTNLGFRCAKDK